jgi:uncharacterized lipoprotein YajG
VELLFVALTVVRRTRAGKDAAMRNLFLILAALPLLAGCSVAKTAVDVALVPVHVATAGVNAALPNQKKADEKRGREMRKEDEERGKQVRMAQERCRKGRPLPTDNCAAVAQR